MSPTIDTGSVALARNVPAGDLRAGDVVSVVARSGERVTHRIVSTEPAPDGVRLTLRGDANRAADPAPYVVDSAYRVFWHAPWVGYAVATLSAPMGLVALASGLFLLAVGARAGTRPRRPGGRRAAHRGRRPRRGRSVVAAVAATIAALTGPAGSASAAPWTDDVLVTGQPLTAATLVAPSISCSGAGLLQRPTISWATPAGPAPTSYLVEYASALTSGTASVAGNSWQLPASLLDVLTTYSITVRSVRAAWQSPVSNTQKVSVTNALGLGVLTTCL
jgi:hypothetical protein